MKPFAAYGWGFIAGLCCVGGFALALALARGKGDGICVLFLVLCVLLVVSTLFIVAEEGRP